MSEIPNNGEGFPDDVWTTAGNEAMQYVEWLVPKPSEYDQAEYVLTVSFARAVMAERERCAQAVVAYLNRVLRPLIPISDAITGPLAVRIRKGKL